VAEQLIDAPVDQAKLSRNGFSLVELLVVMFVMGLLAGAVVLSLPGDSRALRDDAERFAARTVAARDEAISGARPVALVVGSAGYYFEARSNGGWQPLDPGRFGLVSWKQGTAASVAGAAGEGAPTSPGPDAADRQRLVFDPVGLASSEGRLTLRRGNETLAVQIARDGTVRLDAL
jgi:general secretion pathway protein H